MLDAIICTVLPHLKMNYKQKKNKKPKLSPVSIVKYEWRFRNRNGHRQSEMHFYAAYAEFDIVCIIHVRVDS